ncbi:DUF3152 domain-containing protein [Streptomyces sp. JNUCC 64]
MPRVRGGHPEQRESGGGWGSPDGPARPGAGPSPYPGRTTPVPGPRQEYLDAFGTGPGGPAAPGGGQPPRGPRSTLRPPYAAGPYAPQSAGHPANAPTGHGAPAAPTGRDTAGSTGYGAAGPTTGYGAAGPTGRGTAGPTAHHAGAFAAPTGPPGATRPSGRTAPDADDPYASVTRWDPDPAAPGEEAAGHPADPEEAPGGRPGRRATVPRPRRSDDEPPYDVRGLSGRGGKGRAFTGIAAAAVTTVLAVVVAGQVADRDGKPVTPSSTSGEADRQDDGAPSRSESRPTPTDQPTTASAPVAQSYERKMGRTYPLDPELKGSGTFEAVPGAARGQGKGRAFRYRVDVEEGLGLDAGLFADAVHKTLNDDRGWANGGGRTFERVSSGKVDFVITLASPVTTAAWCAKSGLDTTIDNVSCDSAATERVMINAYRWAKGSETYGDRVWAYRQMLINHEVGHRLGFSHVTCQTDGALAPVMQQQTKFLDHNGVSCRANPWPFPEKD